MYGWILFYGVLLWICVSLLTVTALHVVQFASNKDCSLPILVLIFLFMSRNVHVGVDCFKC